MRRSNRRSPWLRKYAVIDPRGAIINDVTVWIAI